MFIFYVLVVVVAFCGGVCVGISDCKRKFGIPKSAVGVDEDGYIYS